MTTLQHTTAPAVSEQAVWAAAQLLLLALIGGLAGLGSVGWFTGFAYAFGTFVLVSHALRRAGTALGPADRVTLARGTLVGVVTALVAERTEQTALLVALAAIALALDCVDGQVARRTGTSSAFGARFDMEVDAFLILVLSAHVALDLGPWVLVIGAARYLFVAASWGLAWLRGALPHSFARKAVAAAQGVILVAATAEVIPFTAVLVGLALVTLLWSFGRDIAWLWRHAPVSVEGSRHV
ncbi:CDP-alcohol phosphatidyltransferase family protein [Crossiella sp. CA198]|uniref:CDP-alcohol phosphatidyltransferase family protein n=1 Tax=Crossiella sp. CA198 TaxID=3455607 RepID=UPI003F8D6FE8